MSTSQTGSAHVLIYVMEIFKQTIVFNRYIAEVKKRSSELRAQNAEYTYLGALRTALHKEKARRQNGVQKKRPATSEEVRRRLSIERRRATAVMETDQVGKILIT